MIESQINYILKAFSYMYKHNLRSIEVRQDAHEKFTKKLQLKLNRLIWQTPTCSSLFQDTKGNNTVLWPDLSFGYIL